MRDICQRWKITELALFGSVLRDDFRPDSDVDVLVDFAPDAELSFTHWLGMEEELERLNAEAHELEEQVSQIPADATHLVVSAGGNNALDQSGVLSMTAVPELQTFSSFQSAGSADQYVRKDLQNVPAGVHSQLSA